MGWNMDESIRDGIHLDEVNLVTLKPNPEILSCSNDNIISSVQSYFFWQKNKHSHWLQIRITGLIQVTERSKWKVTYLRKPSVRFLQSLQTLGEEIFYVTLLFRCCQVYGHQVLGVLVTSWNNTFSMLQFVVFIH